MFQAWLTKPKSFEIRQVEKPKIKSNELLVRVMYCGICGSDLHGYSGKNPFTPFPCVMGHEYVGRVEEAGRDVRNITPGQIVTAEPINNCGNCVYCRSGLYNHCVDKAPRVGGSGEYTVVRQDKAFVVPEGVEPKQTAATDLFESKLQLARSQGCDETIQVKNSTTVEDILNAVGKHSIDVGLIMFNELKLIGCMMYNNGDFADAARILGEGKMDLSPFVSKVFKLRDVEAAFNEIIKNKDRYAKCLVEP
ncbi:MAG TPA: alcohol dehydrogenase catalytic domain-containing protein [Spirochaetia bacterium]|nr:alcohol dehydrogenase catalytic domain-containing protein [Spirochaetia bacterium]